MFNSKFQFPLVFYFTELDFWSGKQKAPNEKSLEHRQFQSNLVQTTHTRCMGTGTGRAFSSLLQQESW